MHHTTWPREDRKAATVQDLRILMARGHNVLDAARRLGVPKSTAYRWLDLDPEERRYR